MIPLLYDWVINWPVLDHVVDCSWNWSVVVSEEVLGSEIWLTLDVAGALSFAAKLRCGRVCDAVFWLFFLSPSVDWRTLC